MSFNCYSDTVDYNTKSITQLVIYQTVGIDTFVYEQLLVPTYSPLSATEHVTVGARRENTVRSTVTLRVGLTKRKKEGDLYSVGYRKQDHTNDETSQ